MTFSRRIAIASMMVACLFATTTHAATVILTFHATLTTGTLAGDQFSGTVGYNPADGTGVGEEFLPLTELNFTLLGATFTKADIDQGGEMITENGAPSYFTAAFFPPPPANSPTDDIAFGFGGPGIIGYFTGQTAGSGVYVLQSTPIPEPTPLALLTVGLAAIAVVARASRRSASSLQE
jgi:hypothetical protein